MLIYKFGGSVLRDAKGIRKMLQVLHEVEPPLIIVVSAFGKITNALEEIAELTFNHQDIRLNERLEQLKAYHDQILSELISDNTSVTYRVFEDLFKEFQQAVKTEGGNVSRGSWYDRVVSYGELFSSVIIKGVLEYENQDISMQNIRNIIITDSDYRAARVDWKGTERRVREVFSSKRIYLTQGYIAATKKGVPTTLGREGSDFTAAILGSILKADKVILWKDVPGVMSADPHVCSDAVFLPRISYQEAAEMSFYGAKVIYPKTIKPLQNKHIPLVVRSLDDLKNPGTIIWDFEEMEHHVPVFISKNRQILLSVFPRDYSFVLNRHLQKLFGVFKEWRFNMNLVQISAISISVCIDDPGELFMERVKNLQRDFEVYFNRGVDLLTFRHYSEKAMESKLQGTRILISQQTRLTAQYIIRRG